MRRETAVMMRIFGLVFLVISVLALPPVGLAAAQDQVLELDLNQLATDYDENELAADLKYKGKKARLTAVVNHVGADALKDNRPYASMLAGRTSSLRLLNLFFSGDQKEALSQALESLISQKPLTVVCTIAESEMIAVVLEGRIIEQVIRP